MKPLKEYSEETQMYVKGKRRTWYKGSAYALLMLLFAGLLAKDQIASTMDYVVNAIHGPTELQQVRKQMWQFQRSMDGMSNQLEHLTVNVRDIDLKLSLPVVNDSGISTSLPYITLISSNPIWNTNYASGLTKNNIQ